MGAGGVCTIWLNWKDTQDLMIYDMIFTYVYMMLLIDLCNHCTCTFQSAELTHWCCERIVNRPLEPTRTYYAWRVPLRVSWTFLKCYMFTLSFCSMTETKTHKKYIDIIILTVWRHLLEISNSQHLQPRLTSTTSQTQTFLRPTDWANVSAG